MNGRFEASGILSDVEEKIEWQELFVNVSFEYQDAPRLHDILEQISKHHSKSFEIQ